MKKFCIVSAVFFSSLVFCTKENPTEISANGDYTDSIVMDLYSYNVYTFTHFKQYYGDVEITAKGQSLLKPLDPSCIKSYDSNTLSAVIVPKYQPNKFEGFIYNSTPLMTVDSTDTTVLVKALSFSRHYFFSLDTASVNFEKCIKPLDLTYMYGYGFVIRDPIWGTGTLKIYYK